MTATAVGSPPAPRPPNVVSPPNRPRSVTRFSLPRTRASGDSSGTSAGPTAAVSTRGSAVRSAHATCRIVQPICSAYRKSTASMVSIRRDGIALAGMCARSAMCARIASFACASNPSMSCDGSASASPSACASASASQNGSRSTLHPAEDVIAGAVQDPRNPRQAVAGQPVLDRADHRHAARRPPPRTARDGRIAPPPPATRGPRAR